MNLPPLKKLPVYRKFAVVDEDGRERRQPVKLVCPLKLQGLMANSHIIQQMIDHPDFLKTLGQKVPQATLCEGSACGAFISLSDDEYGCGFGISPSVMAELSDTLDDAVEEVEGIRLLLDVVAQVAAKALGLNIEVPEKAEEPESEGEEEEEEEVEEPEYRDEAGR